MTTILRYALSAALAGSAIAPIAAQPPLDGTADSLLAPVFRESGALPVTLVTDMRALVRDRRGEPEWQPAYLRFGGASGDSLDAEVRTRGIYRRAKCGVAAPSNRRSRASGAEGTPFQGVNQFKLVAPCEDSHHLLTINSLTEYSGFNPGLKSCSPPLKPKWAGFLAK